MSRLNTNPRTMLMMLALVAATAVIASPVHAADRAVPVEVCNNLLDDDSDGVVDEQQCLIAAASTPISGSGIVPELWNDNPKCIDMGYGFGFKTEGCTSGTYYLIAADGELSGGAPADPNSYVTIECAAGEARVVDWSSNLSMDAVFIKGGPVGGNLYNYDPESLGDSGLGTPDTASGISHVEFCYDYELDVAKTADGVFDRTYTWSIAKDFDGSYQGFIGDPANTHAYQVSVDQTIADSNFAVSGSIDIVNNTPFDAQIVSVADVLSDDTVATVSCGVSFPYLLAAGSSLSCSYAAAPGDASATLNTATVITSGVVGGGTATAPVSFSPTIIGYPTVNVADSNGLTWAADVDTTWTYSRDFVCPSDQAAYTGGVYTLEHENTATIIETGDLDTATVTLACYAPVVSKTAAGAYDERHEWQVEKSVSPVSQTGFAGDLFDFDWTVTVTESVFDEAFEVSGTITVANPNPSSAMTVALSDTLDDGTAGNIDETSCNLTAGLLTVAAGSSQTCAYSASPADAAATLNTATAILNGVAFSAYDGIEWSSNVIRGTAVLTDNQEPLDEVLSGGGPAYTFTYPDTYTCADATSTLYSNGSYSISEDNTAIVSSADEEQDRDTATADFTCRIPALASVIKTTSEGPEEIGQLPFEFGLFAPGADSGDFGNASEIGTLDGAGTVDFASELRQEGTWTIVELLPAGWVNDSLECAFDVFYPDAANQVFECSFANTEMSRVDLLKLTNGIYNPDKTWTFVLYEGANGFGGSVVTSDSTPTDLADAGLLRFGDTDLDPNASYTLCELGIPAGYSVFWQVDSDGDGIGDFTVIPYNPNAADLPPEDLGNRCVDIVPGTGIALGIGSTLHFIVDNQAPGGGPRTPGYWKNWNRCTGGGQQSTAAMNGGWQEGFWLLEDVLDPFIGGGIVWDDILSDDFELSIASCQVAVDILDKRLVGDPAIVGDGRKKASDALHNLATHLLAAQLNFGAGACTTVDALQAALAAEELLDKYNFDGNGHDNLKKNDPDAQLANALANYLDSYNNGELCGDGVE